MLVRAVKRQRLLKLGHRMISTKITLDDTETKIRDLLVTFTKQYPQPLTLRITGGWVRDKLLGRQSHDLDIAIDKLSGLEFAEALNEYISANGGSLGLEPHSIHTIQKNPEKSKHLETATTKLYKLDIDFVNLRSEEYAEDSRIPVMKFGTAEEDAYRRDATLNALFYNLQDQKVEDFTGKGLEDLANGVLRTPLHSFDTFNEDPLRVLRLLRFASTFGFTVAQEALDAMADERIKASLGKKISRERVGVEVDKMLHGAAVHIGVGLVAKLDLEDSIFQLGDAYRPGGLITPQSNLTKVVSSVNELQNCMQIPEFQSVIGNKKDLSMLWVCGILSRWANAQAQERNKPVSAVLLIIREGLKWPIATGVLVDKILKVEPAVRAAASSAAAQPRETLGQLIRQCGEQWRLAFVYSLLKTCIDGEILEKSIPVYSKLASQVMDLGLDNAWDLKPLANGKEIQHAFNMKPGRWMSTATEACINFQLGHPDATNDECLQYLVSIKGRFT